MMEPDVLFLSKKKTESISINHIIFIFA